MWTTKLGSIQRASSKAQTDHPSLQGSAELTEHCIHQSTARGSLVFAGAQSIIPATSAIWPQTADTIFQLVHISRILLGRPVLPCHKAQSLLRLITVVVRVTIKRLPSTFENTSSQGKIKMGLKKVGSSATPSFPPTLASSDNPRSINDTWYWRFTTLAAIKLLGSIRPRHGMIIFLTRTLCVKYGPLRHLPEASTMEFIARHTSIPVPKIYCAFTHNGWTYIVMERVRGECLAHSWRSRSAESRAKILKQLKQMIDSMRRIAPPSLAIANADGGRLWDCRLPGRLLTFGPFDNIDDFHQYLRGGIKAQSNDYPPAINDLVQSHNREWPPPVFTHGDLSSLNILAQGDTITGIVDWETAGWYPQYWEYTTACQVNFRNIFWLAEIGKFLEPWPEELKMEKLRQAYFGDV